MPESKKNPSKRIYNFETLDIQLSRLVSKVDQDISADAENSEPTKKPTQNVTSDVVLRIIDRLKGI